MKRPIILASGSPRRQQLMREAGFDFTVRISAIEETFPHDMPANEVAVFLAKKKASSLSNLITDEILIAADTTVVLGELVLNKPSTRDEAIQMLTLLSGKTHKVITGVCIVSSDFYSSFADETLVTFKTLTEIEIEHYVDACRPFDKAGAYGIQEWIGLIGITAIHGSYSNVVGLPIHRVYDEIVGNFGELF